MTHRTRDESLGALGRGIDALEGQGKLGDAARTQDDVSTPIRFDPPESGFPGECDRCEEIRFEHAPELVLGHGHEGFFHAVPGIGEDAVDSAE